VIFRKILKVARMVSTAYRRSTDPIGYARSIGVKIGGRCELGGNIEWGSEPYLITLGEHVRITNNVVFLTHDGSLWVCRDEHPNAALIRPIVIEDNCSIGMNTIILPGVRIGRDCIIGTGSVVTRSIPPGSLAAGVPARILGTSADYVAKTLPDALQTKGMTEEELRAYLTAHFEAAAPDTERS
jgi:serine acetyltransferase